MIYVVVPDIDDTLPEFTVDPSSPNYWNERLSYLGCVLYRNLHSGGYAFVQMEEADGQSLLDSASTGIASLLESIDSAYHPAPPET
jgi:hypothetical protein